MTAADTITPADAWTFIRVVGAADEAERATALYWRGIITQREYFETVGTISDDDIDARIAALRARVVEWLES